MKSPSRFALTPDRLPPCCGLVLDTLRHSPLPLTAYGGLESRRDHRLKTPIQVCHASGRDALFAICEICGRVAKVEAEEGMASAGRLAVADGFAPSRSGVEILGRCQACTPQDG